MSRVAVLAMVGAVLVAGGCGGGATPTSTVSTTTPQADPIVLKARVVIAAESGAEPIASGDVLEGSTLAGEPFCAGGTIVDNHGSTDPSLWLIVETITCPNGTLSLAFVPDEGQGANQTGSWIMIGGSGAYEGIRGSGGMEVVYGPTADSPADVTFTGTVRR